MVLVELGALSQGAGAVSDIAGRIVNKFNTLGVDDQTITEIGAAGVVTGATALSAKVGGALGAFIIGAGGISGRWWCTLLQEGVAINPHLAVVFRGINFRDHSFTYKFVARDQTESNTIKAIIEAFRFHMLPSNAIGGSGTTAGLAFDYLMSLK